MRWALPLALGLVVLLACVRSPRNQIYIDTIMDPIELNQEHPSAFFLLTAEISSSQEIYVAYNFEADTVYGAPLDSGEVPGEVFWLVTTPDGRVRANSSGDSWWPSGAWVDEFCPRGQVCVTELLLELRLLSGDVAVVDPFIRTWASASSTVKPRRFEVSVDVEGPDIP